MLRYLSGIPSSQTQVGLTQMHACPKYVEMHRSSQPLGFDARNIRPPIPLALAFSLLAMASSSATTNQRRNCAPPMPLSEAKVNNLPVLCPEYRVDILAQVSLIWGCPWSVSVSQLFPSAKKMSLDLPGALTGRYLSRLNLLVEQASLQHQAYCFADSSAPMSPSDPHGAPSNLPPA